MPDFLSTTEFLQWRDAVQRTQSPWIYFELDFASRVEKRDHKRVIDEALELSRLEKRAGVVADFEAKLG